MCYFPSISFRLMQKSFFKFHLQMIFFNQGWFSKSQAHSVEITAVSRLSTFLGASHEPAIMQTQLGIFHSSVIYPVEQSNPQTYSGPVMTEKTLVTSAWRNFPVLSWNCTYKELMVSLPSLKNWTQPRCLYTGLHKPVISASEQLKSFIPSGTSCCIFMSFVKRTAIFFPQNIHFSFSFSTLNVEFWFKGLYRHHRFLEIWFLPPKAWHIERFVKWIIWLISVHWKFYEYTKQFLQAGYKNL